MKTNIVPKGGLFVQQSVTNKKQYYIVHEASDSCITWYMSKARAQRFMEGLLSLGIDWTQVAGKINREVQARAVEIKALADTIDPLPKK